MYGLWGPSQFRLPLQSPRSATAPNTQAVPRLSDAWVQPGLEPAPPVPIPATLPCVLRSPLTPTHHPQTPLLTLCLKAPVSARAAPSLPSGVCSNVTFSERPAHHLFILILFPKCALTTGGRGVSCCVFQSPESRRGQAHPRHSIKFLACRKSKDYNPT